MLRAVAQNPLKELDHLHWDAVSMVTTLFQQHKMKSPVQNSSNSRLPNHLLVNKQRKPYQEINELIAVIAVVDLLYTKFHLSQIGPFTVHFSEVTV